MAKSVKSLEKLIGKLEKELNGHREKAKKAKPEDAFVHNARAKGTEEALSKAKADLILAKAEASRKEKGKK